MALSALALTSRAFAQPGERIYRLASFQGTGGPVLREGTILEHLARHGYEEGRNLEIHYVPKWFGDNEKLDASVREMLAWKPDVILTGLTFNTRVTQRATATVPIVFINVADPISAGFVKSLARPGGNITGVSVHNLSLWPKRLELIRELVPRARRVAVILDGTFARDGYPPEFYQEMREVAKRLKLELIEEDVVQTGSLGAAFERAALARPDFVLPLGPWPNIRMIETLEPSWAKSQDRYRIPVLGFFPLEGGPDDRLVVQLGAHREEMWEIGAALVARVLAGADPAEIPVQQQTKLELVINLKTARELGIAVPKEILKRADRVIE